LDLLKEIDPSDYENVQVYDGDLTTMTFSHVKNSQIFETKKGNKFEVEEDLQSSIFDSKQS
jgi:hypothetical protein